MKGPLREGDDEKLKEGIRDALKGRREILVAYLYGSTAKRRGGKGSDVDIGLLLNECFKADALYSSRIAREIKKKLNLSRDVDVRILNGRSYRFLNQVIRNGEVILSADDRERARFEAAVVDLYLDFKPFYEEYDEKRRERILV
ncbi:MAG: nucleotidyltransferase domain-containing protein [Candidatus Brockarchaeota archaeon]|nr:nucleotidyltransferase domain-containing protein [Candidatus Brockarchaeota archaeon]